MSDQTSTPSSGEVKVLEEVDTEALAIRAVEQYQPVPKLVVYQNAKVSYSEASNGSFQKADDISIIHHHMPEIMRYVLLATTVIDLGVGDPAKMKLLLKILQAHTYAGIDVQELKQSIDNLHATFPDMIVYGLRCSFKLGLQYLRDKIEGPSVFVILGSMLLNVSSTTNLNEEHAELLKSLAEDDLLLFSQDKGQCTEADLKSYYQGPTFLSFIESGIYAPPFSRDDWSIVGEVHSHPRQHIFYLEAKNDVRIGKRLVNPGERVEFFPSVKLTVSEVEERCHGMGLHIIKHWTTAEASNELYLCKKAK